MNEVQEILPFLRKELSKYSEDGIIGRGDYRPILGCMGLVLENQEKMDREKFY